MENKSNNSSKSKSNISVFDKFQFKNGLINFYNEYKDNLQDILNLVYNELGCPKINEKLINNSSIINKLKSGPIVIDKYHLQCMFDFNEVVLKKINNNNCNLKIKYFSKLKINNDEIDKELWVCNKHISIILADNKYIYIYILK